MVDRGRNRIGEANGIAPTFACGLGDGKWKFQFKKNADGRRNGIPRGDGSESGNNFIPKERIGR